MKFLIFAAIMFSFSIVSTSCSSSDKEPKATAETATQSKKQLYTCGMHPQIIRDEPGDCPICGMKLTPVKESTAGSMESIHTGEKKIIYYKDPMHPWYTSDKPGKAPDCGMDLVPVYEGSEGSAGVVRIDPAVEQNINVKIGTAERRTLSTTITTSGHIGVAESGLTIINTKINGWAEKLYVDYMGQSVRKGQKLMEIYSPQLVAAEEELVTALGYKEKVSRSSNTDVLASGDALIENAKNKLKLWDISEQQIEQLIETRKVQRTLVIYSPSNGVVLEKNIIQGQFVNAGTMLLKIADLSTVWLHADLYEYELAQVNVGQKAIMRLQYIPGKEFTGRVAFIYPTLDPKARTGKVRIDFPNPTMELKPEMFATVEIRTTPQPGLIVVPEQSVIRSGKRNIVIVSLGNGRFEPRDVVLGIYSDGFYEVKKNLEAGEKIVLSSQFLIDSESNLRSALSSMVNAPSDSMQNEGMKMNPPSTQEHQH